VCERRRVRKREKRARKGERDMTLIEVKDKKRATRHMSQRRLKA